MRAVGIYYRATLYHLIPLHFIPSHPACDVQHWKFILRNLDLNAWEGEPEHLIPLHVERHRRDRMQHWQAGSVTVILNFKGGGRGGHARFGAPISAVTFDIDTGSYNP
jgi:hypothetical protein